VLTDATDEKLFRRFILYRVTQKYKRVAHHGFRLILTVEMQSSEDVYQYSCACQQVVQQ